MRVKYAAMIQCSPDDLAANRQGQLSAQQRTWFESRLERGRKIWWFLAGVWIVVVAIGASGVMRTHAAAPTIAGSAVLAALGVIPLVLLGRRVSARVRRRFEEDTVEHLTGRLQDYRRGQGDYCFVSFNGQRMTARLDLIQPYRQELESTTHHVYYLKNRRDLLSIEPA